MFLQLAVLATYVGDELLAVYRYFRSLAVESPFLTARDNLIILFEKVVAFCLLSASLAVNTGILKSFPSMSPSLGPALLV